MLDSVRVRLILIACVATAGAAVGLSVVQGYVIRHSYADLEHREGILRTEQVRGTFTHELESLDFTLHDWAVWDEAYAYVVAPTQAFEEGNLTPTALAGINLDLLVVTDLSGEPIVARSLVRGTGDPSHIPELDTLGAEENPLGAVIRRALAAPDGAVLGIVRLRSGPMLLGARLVTPTKGNAPANGVMLMGRMLDAEVVASLAERAGLPLDFAPLDASDGAPAGLTERQPVDFSVLDSERTAGRVLLSDLDGNAIGLLSFELDRPIAEAARETFDLLSTMMILGMLALGAVLVVATNRAVIRPLHSVTTAINGIATSRDLTAAVPVPRGEIGTLANSVNSMLSELHAAAAERRRQEKRFRAMVAHSSDAISIVADSGVVLYTTPSSANVWRRSADVLRGLALQDVVVPEDVALLEAALRASTERQGAERLQVHLLNEAGERRAIEVIIGECVEWQSISGWIVDARDVTDRERFSEALRHQATHDELTGLPNRAALYEHLKGLWAHGPTERSFLFIDLDNFKLINDTLGHAGGDQLLVAVAARLRNLVHAEDFVARLGGDEFVVLLRIGSPGLAVVRAEMIARALADPIDLGRQQIVVTGSIGVAVSNQMTADPEQTLRDADMALYRAKANGKASTVLFDSALDVGEPLWELPRQIVGATRRGEMRVHFQPVVSLASGAVEGFETLMCWDSPLGLLEPAEFLRAARESGEMVEIGQLALREACGLIGRLGSEGTTAMTVSVNVSVREFVAEGFVGGVLDTVRESGIASGTLWLEITEDTFIGDLDAAIQKLGELRAAGVRVALDDFGTGFSSLGHLERLPIDAVKLDASFVAKVASSSRSRALMAALLHVAGALDLGVIAEGVERADQVRVLRDLRVDLAQGGYFGEPLPMEAALRALGRASLPRSA
ncbi:MAG: EAL domain-containing protein [Dehalococcoidia bacterium]